MIANGIISEIHAMIIKDATARACLAVASSRRGANHNVTGTAIASKYPASFRGDVRDPAAFPMSSAAGTPFAIRVFL